jgi:hypothetical protein
MRICDVRPFALSLAALFAAAVSAQAAPRAVIELFTSPNCSSCPPADALFVKLARDPDLITLVMPVDYLGRGHHKDDITVHAFSERQAAYADVRNEEMLFTPQAMINGTAPAEGSDPGEIGDAIAQTSGALSVPVTATASGSELLVSVGPGDGAEQRGMVTVLPFIASKTVKAYGERITYANLARGIERVASWTGAPMQRSIPLNDFTRYDGVVVLLQAGTPERPGAILGATRIFLRAHS